MGRGKRKPVGMAKDFDSHCDSYFKNQNKKGFNRYLDLLSFFPGYR